MPSTQPSDLDVEAFLDNVEPERRRTDARRMLALMREITGAEPVMWGTSIIGFGRQPYTTADGKAHEWFAVGFSPRKAALTLYGLTYYGSNAEILADLGPHTTGKGCVYVKRLENVDVVVLRRLVERAWDQNHVSSSRPPNAGRSGSATADPGLSSAATKLAATNRHEAVNTAQRMGWI